jgi:hypothetical protein
MHVASRLVLAGIGIVLAVWLVLKCVLPLVLMYSKGVGVEVPFPKGLWRKYPRLVIMCFTIGGPTLFLLLLAGILYILRR